MLEQAKSYFFNQHPFYHKIATNASGVSRYQINTNADGYLLDDIKSNTLDHKTNRSTVQNLALGGTATVKICRSTQQIRGFVVCTSNNTPNFISNEMLENPNQKTNYNAWRRRFIAINFTTLVDEDPINAQFGYTSATDALKCYFNFCYNLMKISDVKNMFLKYYLAINESLSPECLETFKELNLILPTFMDNTDFEHPTKNKKS